VKTASEIAELIRGLASDSPGISEITVDGIHIKIDRSALDYWERRAAREVKPTERPISFSVDLS